MKWNIGCSGFGYKEWKGIFYPDKLAQTKWLEFYGTHFNTVELNMTFYRFPELKLLEGWYNKSPDKFSFTVKVPRSITHYKKLIDAEKLLQEFYSVCKEGLKDKLGPLLFQFPPQFTYTPENLQRILTNLDSNFTNVVEFRHFSWWHQEVYNQLKKANITFCGISHPTLPNDVIINTQKVYYRFHGVPKIFYSSYDKNFIDAVAEKISANNTLTDIYCYFNNTAAVAAIHNAQSLQLVIAGNKKGT
ncbi:MAG: DUF72 domain-containing protein [Sphingobacteriales bacterium]|nr:DUF72 domain-containing protein [Sphingobacteriales bacterium]